MIRFSDNNDIKKIVTLWHEAFGDGEDEIMFFLANRYRPENTVVYEINGEIASMLFLLEGKMSINSKIYNSYYLYAACTLKKYRGRGYMGELLRFAERIAAERNIGYICLLPGESSLYRYYEKFGYKTAFAKKILKIKRADINENSDSIEFTADYNSFDLEKLRENALNKTDHFIWDNQSINYASKQNEMYGGKAVVTCNGYLLYSVESKKIVVKECTFSPKYLKSISALLLEKENADEIIFHLAMTFQQIIGAYEDFPGGMLLPLSSEAEIAASELKNAYLGLTLD
ncbi:MAG: GNAT family N-acetyltransferase [Acutalibacteraceae bacterium]